MDTMETMGTTRPKVACCQCSTPIYANPTNMCASCVRASVDITEGLPRSLTVHSCRGCGRWLSSTGRWMQAELESRELLALCLKRIRGLQKVKLVDAGWIWTEPHSRRLKVRLRVQKEVMRGAVLQAGIIVEYVQRNQQCTDCARSFTTGAWKAVVQIRQRVHHKRTFLFLEQIILKNQMHAKALYLQEFPDGIDVYVVESGRCCYVLLLLLLLLLLHFYYASARTTRSPRLLFPGTLRRRTWPYASQTG
jgi:nonsense-mediated mRNA decay protein 3